MEDLMEDLYLYFHFGPASVGEFCIPYFLETVEEIQKTVQRGTVSNRKELRERNTEE